MYRTSPLKSVFFVAGLLVVHIIWAQAPSQKGYKIYYEMTFQKDSNDSKLTSEMTELLTSGGKSLFRTVLQAEKDTNNYYVKSADNSLANVYTEASYRIFKDHENHSSRRYEVIEILGGPMCAYIESHDSMRWTLTSDTLTIHGYLCQRASLHYGNRVWEAWFAPDIPISDGPYTFCGLPGLIVQIRDRTGSWLFNLTHIAHVPAFTFDLPFLEDAEVEVIEKMAFYKRKRYYTDNSMEINEAKGSIWFDNEVMRQRILKTAKINAVKNNNWIELYP
ncbi:GLPGLI family protein [Parapedobacter luteus]|uniref:GLPGLI family protein n=1 Tax=Parapedobacter luteus TaxID=623280 RepID=A0A1T4ZU57_9SPHI|nr:GLPGLI family protein [Parapedobacter luteus]SKB26270.1 GLPGLI family protein [Parapedobacter luteus]